MLRTYHVEITDDGGPVKLHRIRAYGTKNRGKILASATVPFGESVPWVARTVARLVADGTLHPKAKRVEPHDAQPPIGKRTPPSPNPRQDSLTVLVTLEQGAHVRACAEKARVSVSDYIRRLLPEAPVGSAP